MFAILFLSAYVLSTTELIQFLKLPILFEHFSDHKNHSPQLSFIDFLALHYSGDHFEGHPHDEDYEKDMNLPFITHANVLTLCCTDAPNFVFEWMTKAPQVDLSTPKIYKEEFVTNEFLSSIWQPPKFC